MKTIKVLYWDVGKSSFVLKDLAILNSQFRVYDYTFKAKNNFSIVFEFTKQFFICVYRVFSCNVVICQFSGYHSLVPLFVFKLFGKKRIIVAGGTDCVAFPSIKYGNFQKKYLKWFTKKSFQLSNYILPVDETLIQYDYTYQNSDYKKQGYRTFIKNLNAIDKVIYNGYDYNRFNIIDKTRKRNSFLTVGANLKTSFGPKLKGIDLIIEVSKLFKDYTFAIVGGKGFNENNVPENVILLDNIPNSELPKLYNQYEFYMQLSMSEGFPNSLCEAMLCGCIPIVSNVGAMPKIIENTPGYVLDQKDVVKLKQILEDIRSVNIELEQRIVVRNKIMTHYTIENRKEELISLIKSFSK